MQPKIQDEFPTESLKRSNYFNNTRSNSLILLLLRSTFHVQSILLLSFILSHCHVCLFLSYPFSSCYLHRLILHFPFFSLASSFLLSIIFVLSGPFLFCHNFHFIIFSIILYNLFFFLAIY